MFPNQPIRALYPQHLAMMAQFQATPQTKDLAAMSAFLANLQKINQANLLAQKYEKEYSVMQPQAPVVSAREVSSVSPAQSLNTKRNLDVKLEQEIEENIQKKLKTPINAITTMNNIAAHTTSTKTNMTPIRNAKLPARFQTNYMKYKKSQKKVNGSFEAGDQVSKVLAFKFNKDTKNIQYLVEWKPRKDGTKPQQTFVDRDILLQRDASAVAVYYENQIFSARNSFAFQ